MSYVSHKDFAHYYIQQDSNQFSIQNIFHFAHAILFHSVKIQFWDFQPVIHRILSKAV